MPIRNAHIAAIFEEIADLHEIGGENPFRIRVYRNGARAVPGVTHVVIAGSYRQARRSPPFLLTTKCVMSLRTGRRALLSCCAKRYK